ncbi:MAG: methyl-accepting chemotaxis protein, partial [Myxococcota bacterium]
MGPLGGDSMEDLQPGVGSYQSKLMEIAASSSKIARAASDIGSGQTTLSARTQQQAAALEQTAATV